MKVSVGSEAPGEIPYAAVLHRLEHGLLILRRGDAVVFANQAAASLFGLTIEEIVGMPSARLSEMVRELVDEPPPVIREGRLLPEGRQVVCEEFELVRPSRSVIRWVAQPVDGAAGEHQMIVCTDITAEVDLTAGQLRFALTDRLTGLWNRRGAEDAIRREISRARRKQTPLAFVMMDLDHFKWINDTRGHLAGDRVLELAAKLMKESLRASDLAARWGGEEFLLVLPDTDSKGARVCAERVRGAIGATGEVTVSGGVAVLEDGDEDGSSIIARADARLYQAKAAGRDCIR